MYILYSSGFTNALTESASMWAFVTLKGSLGLNEAQLF